MHTTNASMPRRNDENRMNKTNKAILYSFFIVVADVALCLFFAGIVK